MYPGSLPAVLQPGQDREGKGEGGRGRRGRQSGGLRSGLVTGASGIPGDRSTTAAAPPADQRHTADKNPPVLADRLWKLLN